MTKFRFDFVRKIFTPTKFTTPININYAQKKKKKTMLKKDMLVRSAWTGPPAPAHKLHLPSLALLPYVKKHQARRLGDPGCKINVCRFHNVCWFQFWSCSIVKVRHCHGLVLFIWSRKYSSLKIHNKFTINHNKLVQFFYIIIFFIFNCLLRIIKSRFSLQCLCFPTFLSLGSTYLLN